MPTTRDTDLTDFQRRLAGEARSGLLVSVRHAEEAHHALAGGADVIDIKEPANGPLGRAGWSTVQAIVDRVSGRAPVTVALGELSECGDLDGCPQGLAAGKIGLAGVSTADLVTRLEEHTERLARIVPIVPVGYADSDAAQSPLLDSVLDAAIGLHCGWMVVDTWDKLGPPLLECCQPRSLAQLIDRARIAGVGIVLAGRLSNAAVPAAAALGPVLVGVRGAACDGGRTGAISLARVQSLVTSLAAGAAHYQSPKPA